MTKLPPLADTLKPAIRLAVTGVVVVAAGFAIKALWDRYEVDPWTRDGRVRADIVQIAPDVPGLVTAVYVVNDQSVKKGDPIFQVDPARYRLALSQAQTTIEQTRAAITSASAALAEARREAARNHQLGELVPLETTQQSDAKVEADAATLAAAKAAADAALVARDTAKLNLDRTLVRAPYDGVISEAYVKVGDYVSPGKMVIALFDRATLRIEGYFEETKLAGVHLGQKATARLMGDGRLVHGHVISIAAGIEDHDRQASANMVPNINPSFSWVRLAQRVPVRIAIDDAPGDLALVAGRTVTVSLERDEQSRRQAAAGARK